MQEIDRNHNSKKATKQDDLQETPTASSHVTLMIDDAEDDNESSTLINSDTVNSSFYSKHFNSLEVFDKIKQLLVSTKVLLSVACFLFIVTPLFFLSTYSQTAACIGVFNMQNKLLISVVGVSDTPSIQVTILGHSCNSTPSAPPPLPVH